MDNWVFLFAQALGAPPVPAPTPTFQPPSPSPGWWEKGLTFLIGAVGGWISGTLKTRGQQRVAIDSLVLKLIELPMEYPYLERGSYCAAWAKDGEDTDDRARYESYCCLVFNTIQKAWELNWPWFWNAARHKHVSDIVHVEELIWQHRNWWEGDRGNVDGYPPRFRAYVLFVIDKCRRENRT